MTRFGCTLLSEDHPPRRMVEVGRQAERAGFDFLAVSDHYHPWLPEQHHSPYAWSVLGALAVTTEEIGLVTMVTCPIVRYHPAVVAQKAATVALLSGERFTLGVGAGEELNEHVVGEGWPPIDVRHEMLAEALDAMRLLWQGGYRTYRGDHVTVEDARVFDLPDEPVPLAVAASGERSAGLAAELGDELICDQPLPEIVDAYRAAGGTGKTWTQIPVCWDEDEARALRTAHDHFRFSALGWKVMSELPNPVNFAAATASVTPEALGEKIPAGPDPDRYAEVARSAADAGYDRIAFLQLGDDQEGFFRFWERELAPRLADRAMVGTS